MVVGGRLLTGAIPPAAAADQPGGGELLAVAHASPASTWSKSHRGGSGGGGEWRPWRPAGRAARGPDAGRHRARRTSCRRGPYSQAQRRAAGRATSSLACESPASTAARRGPRARATRRPARRDHRARRPPLRSASRCRTSPPASRHPAARDQVDAGDVPWRGPARTGASSARLRSRSARTARSGGWPRPRGFTHLQAPGGCDRDRGLVLPLADLAVELAAQPGAGNLAAPTSELAFLAAPGDAGDQGDRGSRRREVEAGRLRRADSGERRVPKT